MFAKLLADSGGADEIVDTHRRARLAAGTAVGDGAGGRDHRPADVLRDRPRAADAGHLPGRQAVAAVPDHRRNPGAGRAFRDARAGATAPRPADRDRPARRRSRHHAGAGCRRGDPDRHRRRSVVRQARRPVGGPGRAGPLRGRRFRHAAAATTRGGPAAAGVTRHRLRPARAHAGRASASRCSASCCPSP